MTDADQDPMLRRAIEELRQLPPVDPEAVRRVVGAAAAARLTPADEPVFITPARGRSIRVWSAIGMAAAAAVVGFVARGQWAATKEAPIATASAQTEAAAGVQLAASSESESRPILQQF